MSETKENIPWRICLLIVIAVSFFLFLIVITAKVITLSDISRQNEALSQAGKQLQMENEALQNQIDMLTGTEPYEEPNENSQELELLNTIGQVIQESKSVDITIENESGKVHFVYESKD